MKIKIFYYLLNFKHYYNNFVKKDIPVNVTSNSLKKYLESLNNIGLLEIERNETSMGYKWIIKWSIGGDQNLILVILVLYVK